jgi:hypothetical protein
MTLMVMKSIVNSSDCKNITTNNMIITIVGFVYKII